AGRARQTGQRQSVAHDEAGIIARVLPTPHHRTVDRMVILNSPHPVPLARELRTMCQKVRFIYQLFVQPPLLPLLLPWLMRRAGRFTETDIQVMKESWRDPAARRAMANYYTALRRHRRALRPLIRPIDIPVILLWG